MPPGSPGQKLEATYKYTQDGTIDIQLVVPKTGEEVAFQTRAEVDEAEIQASKAKVEREKGELSDQKEEEVEGLLQNLKEALAAEEESEIRRLEEDLTDLLFELDL